MANGKWLSSAHVGVPASAGEYRSKIAWRLHTSAVAENASGTDRFNGCRSFYADNVPKLRTTCGSDSRVAATKRNKPDGAVGAKLYTFLGESISSNLLA